MWKKKGASIRPEEILVGNCRFRASPETVNPSDLRALSDPPAVLLLYRTRGGGGAHVFGYLEKNGAYVSLVEPGVGG